MRRNGIKTDIVTYRTLIYIYGRKGDIKKMEELLEEMRKNDTKKK